MNHTSEPGKDIKDPQLVNGQHIQQEKAVSVVEDINQSELSFAEIQKLNRQQKLLAKDQQILNNDHWLARDGHTLTYVGIFLFTLTLYFRPYELIPALSGFSSMALVIAIATLLIYLPTQFSTEGSLSTFPTEIKCILFIAFWAILTIPIAKDPALAWRKFSGDYVKVIIMFVIMVNSLQTKSRLKGLMWLSISVGVMLSYQALLLYQKGEFKAEGYRVNVEFGGMFGNPNDLAMHLVIFTPIALLLGIASKNIVVKLVYFVTAAMMVAGSIVTQSRGAFLGLIAVGAVLVWKLGRNNRLQAIIISSAIALMLIVLAPGNYGLRILSIFVPGLDPVGSSDQRKELLIQSLWVTLRNPLGIGFANFPVVGIRNLQTHNAYTQVSSELGWIAIAVYLILLISPLRKLGAIERRMFAQGDFSWIYHLSIGVQASIAGYMVASFFGPVAYDWFVYYPIAYAICLRRIYQLEQAAKGVATENNLMGYLNLQKT
ncbi:MAG: O-antigen ligase family protein [Pyrinomonadaceae bacterium]